MYRVLGAFILGLIFVGTAFGQESTVLNSGTRIRFTLAEQTPADAAVSGTFVNLSADSLAYRSSLTNEINAVPIDRLTSFDRRRSRDAGEGAVRGLKWGAPIGGVFGLAVGGACAAQDDEWWWWHHDGCSAGEVVLVSVVMAGVGGGIGALIGAALPGERWEPVSLQALRLGVASKDRGVAWSVSFAL
jgi:hypothetical protein